MLNQVFRQLRIVIHKESSPESSDLLLLEKLIETDEFFDRHNSTDIKTLMGYSMNFYGIGKDKNKLGMFVYSLATETVKKDKSVIKVGLRWSPQFIQKIDDTLKKDKDLLLFHFKYHSKTFDSYFNIIPKEFWDDKSFIISLSEFRISKMTIYNSISKQLKEDIEVVIHLLNIEVYRQLSLKVQKNHRVLKKLMKKNSKIYFQFPKNIQKEKDIILLSLKYNSYQRSNYEEKKIFERNISLHSNDENFIKSIILYDGSLLKFVNERFQNDKKIVMLAMKSNMKANKYLKNFELNENDYQQIIRNDSRNFYKYQNQIKDVKKFIIDSIEDHPSIIKSLSKSFYTQEFIHECVKKNGACLSGFNVSYFELTEDILLASVKSYKKSKLPHPLKFLNKLNEEIAFESIRRYPPSFMYLKELKLNCNIAFEACKLDKNNFHHLNSQLLQNELLMMKLMKELGVGAFYYDRFIHKNREYALCAIENNPSRFIFTSQQFKDDEQIAQLAMKKRDNYKHLSQRLKSNIEFQLKYFGYFKIFTEITILFDVSFCFQ
eukprot:gene12750-7026_t